MQRAAEELERVLTVGTVGFDEYLDALETGGLKSLDNDFAALIAEH